MPGGGGGAKPGAMDRGRHGRAGSGNTLEFKSAILVL